MSTIFGICRKEGPAGRGEAGLRMLEAMDHWSPDHRGLLETDGVLLGHLLLRNTPESAQETGPLHLDRLTIAADARIDNRAELLHDLGLEGESAKGMPDALLILHVYRARGTGGLARLVGDYAFAIHDPDAFALVCARDPMGVRPFYYARLGGDLLFASEPKGILAHPEADAAPDDDFILRLMAGIPPGPDATFHRHIRHLPPGHVLRWTPGDLQVSPLRMPVIPPLLRLRDAGAYQEAFREQLRQAVACRLRTVGPVGVELSGGLDSSAVAAFAAGLLPDRDRLHSFTNVHPDGASAGIDTADEWPYAEAVARHCGIARTVRVARGGSTHPFEAFDLHISDHCGVDIISPFWLEPARRLMRERGIRTCLSGFFGDEVATHPGRLHYHDFLEDGRPIAFLRACLGHGDYLLPLRRLARSLLPGSWQQALRKPTAAAQADAGYLLGGLAVPDAAMPSGGHPPRPYSHRRHLHRLATGIHALRRMQNESLAAIRHRIEPRYPFADIRLVEFVLSLPPEMTGHARTDRYLYRSSLAGIVPDAVRLRTDKQVPTGVFPVHELRAQAPAIRRELAELRQRSGHPFLARLDFDRIDRELDPSLAANRWQGAFFPRVPFHILALARCFDDRPGGAGLPPGVRHGRYRFSS
jgi:asparagine synthase (glutamine-hydrolysing)